MSDENCKGLIGGGMFVDPIPVAFILFQSKGGDRVVTIHADGRVEPGKGFAPDEAGRQAILGMQDMLSNLIEAAAAEKVKAEREACAKIADDLICLYDGERSFESYDMAGAQNIMARDIADAIRART